MGIRERVSALFSERPEVRPRILIHCTINLTHDDLPEPIPQRGQEVLKVICTPCYNKHLAQLKSSATPGFKV